MLLNSKMHQIAPICSYIFKNFRDDTLAPKNWGGVSEEGELTPHTFPLGTRPPTPLVQTFRGRWVTVYDTLQSPHHNTVSARP